MREISREKLQEIIESHGKWVYGKIGGNRANLRDANLCDANLCGANLRDANLCDANLCGANLCDANLCGANLPKRITQIGPIGSRKSYTLYNATDNIVLCGCWNNYRGGSLEEFKKRIDDVYPSGIYRAEYLAAINLFETLSNIDK